MIPLSTCFLRTEAAMTEDETDAGTMRLVRKYVDIRRKHACVSDRLHELGRGAEAAAASLRNMNSGDYGKTRTEFDAVDWVGISNVLGELLGLKIERERIESCLREASLGDLIR